MNKYQELIEELEKTLLELDTISKRHASKAKHHKVMGQTDTDMGQDRYHLANAELNEGAERGLNFAITKISSTIMNLNFKNAKIKEGGKDNE
jgi:hypothetical protein